jgi:hypothetical protein
LKLYNHSSFLFNRVFILIYIFSFFSCKKDKNDVGSSDFNNGVFVVNEGIYGQTSGTISFMNFSNNEVSQDIFKNINGRDLGNVVQSMYIHNDMAYIVVNNSNKIEVVKTKDFKEYAQINSLEQPRYFLPIDSNFALVSQWGLDLLSGSVAVIDLNSNTIVQKISQGIGRGPEKMLLHNGLVYVSNVGGLDYDNFISVIDINSRQVIDTIQTDFAPNSLEIDANNLLWVACKGKTVYSNYPNIDSSLSTEGSLISIDLQTRQIVDRISLGKAKGASQLTKANSSSDFYFNYDNQLCILNTNTKLWHSIIPRNFYGIGLHNNIIYGATYRGIQSSWIVRYNATTYSAIDSFRAGIFANSFVFN